MTFFLLIHPWPLRSCTKPCQWEIILLWRGNVGQVEGLVLPFGATTGQRRLASLQTSQRSAGFLSSWTQLCCLAVNCLLMSSLLVVSLVCLICPLSCMHLCIFTPLQLFFSRHQICNNVAVKAHLYEANVVPSKASLGLLQGSGSHVTVHLPQLSGSL